jgi:hypothetical protein
MKRLIVILRVAIIGIVLSALCLFPMSVEAVTINITNTPLYSAGIISFTVTYVSDAQMDLDWTVDATVDKVMVRAKYGNYPANIPDAFTAPTDGYLVYYGAGLSVSDTSMNFDQNPGGLYYEAWGQKLDGTWYTVTSTSSKESARMMTLAACIVFLGMAMTFSILGHIKRQWWFSTIGALTWLGVFFWWLQVGLTSLFGMTGTYTDIIIYLPLMLVFFIFADVVNYWNTVEVHNQGQGKSWTTYGGVPKDNFPSSYESYKDELQRRLGTTQRRGRGGR